MKSEEGQKLIGSGAISNFIKSASRLEELDIFGRNDIASNSIFDTKFVWTHLKKLSLFMVGLETSSMINLFKRHSTILERVRLEATSLEKSYAAEDWIDFFERVMRESDIHLKSLQFSHIESDLEKHEDMSFRSWKSLCPDTVPSSRAIRYLMCGEKTNMLDEEDECSHHPYDWDSLTWASIKEDFQVMREHHLDLYEDPDSWVPLPIG
ncbi:hypothetical protein MMC10_011433 [Thelotrema lepadinum]|nr:hypothetical protein [Thelotrema lepadinum]